MTTLEQVGQFHRAFGHPVHDRPKLDDYNTNTLRIALIAEELAEFVEALTHRDPVAVLDALTDLQVVLDGAYLSLGFHRYKDAAFAEVHRSNMSKLPPDGKPLHREDGKIMKGPGYTPPNLEAILLGP